MRNLKPVAASVVVLWTLLVSLAASASLPAAPEAPPQQGRQEQDPETRIAGEEAPEEISGQRGTTPQTPRYAPNDYRGGEFRQRTETPPGLGTAVAALVGARNAGGNAGAALYANRHDLEWRDGSVLVRVDAGLPIPGMRLADASSRAIVEDVLAALSARGARVRNVFGPHIEAWVPATELSALGVSPSVRAVTRPWKMRSSATSEGVSVIGADRWAGIEFRSPVGGLKVGVIDLGFKGWEGLQGRDLPPADRLFTRSFRDDEEIENDDEHGTAVAEIIYDIEQDMTMYLAAIETIGDINEAMTYLIESGVDVINMSLGCAGCGPGDGSGTVVEVVERGPQAAIPFVTSAGNEANRHWIGSYVDGDGDGFHEFAPGDESNSFPGDQGDEVLVTMVWDFSNWFASNQDFDLLLLDANGNVVDESRELQAGLSGQRATEEIAITLPFSGTFHVVVQEIQSTGPQTIELFVDQRGLEYVVREKSLTVPADGDRVVAVGAARWSTDLPESFSSQGPTKDGRMKPDMAGPDGVSTESFGPLGFFGTSAAAPHVVGAVALLRGRLGLLSGPEALQVLMPRLIDLSPSGPDNISGGGRVSVIPPS